jgi:uncharacterized protein YjbJ (UPF0337 family)
VVKQVISSLKQAVADIQLQANGTSEKVEGKPRHAADGVKDTLKR